MDQCLSNGRCDGQRTVVFEGPQGGVNNGPLIVGEDDGAAGDTPFTAATGGSFTDCATSSASGELTPVAMFVMFDRSSSMRQNVQGSTRWDVATDALIQFFQDPGSADLRVAYGVFPGAENGCSQPACDALACAQPVVPVGTLTAQSGAGDAHEQALVNYVTADDASTQELELGTPTSVALDGALRWAADYQNTHDGEAATVVLVTDGEPTACDDNIGNIANFASTALDDHGIRTYAIGLTGSREGDMNEIARAGGTEGGIFIGDGTDTGAQLRDALAQIRGEVASCDLQMPEPAGGVVDPKKVNVALSLASGDVDLGQVEGSGDCADLAGWYYDNNSSPTRILLCPATCDAVQTDPVSRIDIVLGCATNISPPTGVR
jgi:hypothetical protein